MNKFGWPGDRFRFQISYLFQSCRPETSCINHTNKIVVLVFLAVLTQEICYTLIGAVNSGGSGSNHPKRGKTIQGSDESNLIWNEQLLQTLLYIWLDSEPTTEGHADRMFRTWSSDPMHFPPMSKRKLYEIARQIIEEGKFPLLIGSRGEQEEIPHSLLVTLKRIRWTQFKMDANKFLAELPEGRLKFKKPICDIFLEKYHHYGKLDRQVMSRYMYNERFRTGKQQGDSSLQSSRHPSQSSVAQHFEASSSQLPQIDTHSQRHSNPHYLQPSDVEHTHSEMLSSMPQLPQYIQSHYSPDQLHQGDSGYYHGESSSQIPRFRVERPATTRHNHTSDEHERGKRSRTRSQSGSSSSQRDDDDLDLDLHL